MIIYRLAIDEYKDDLSGTGAKLFGGRWNSTGISALYTTQNISLAVLEILVRTDKHSIPIDYFLLKIEIPDTEKISTIHIDKLKKNWKDDLEYTQFMGDEFIKTTGSFILQVPSAIIPEESNFIINPKHANFKKVKIIFSKKFKFDNRLFLNNE